MCCDQYCSIASAQDVESLLFSYESDIMTYCLLFISDNETIITCSVFTVCAKPAVKKKSVRFGSPLSPEVFDKTMPPSTPLRKGATPAQTPTPGGGSALRSALKTPQMSDSDVSHASPDPCSPFMFGASPLLGTSETHGKFMAADSEEEGKVDSGALKTTIEFNAGMRDSSLMSVFFIRMFSDCFPINSRLRLHGT